MRNKFTLLAVGDIFPANLGYHNGIGICGTFQKHNGSIWKDDMVNCLSKADIAIANLEGPIIPDSNKAAKISFAGCKEFITFLKEVGIDIVSIANNHIMEQGEQGFHYTIDQLKKNQIHIIGQAGINSNIFFYKVNDMTIAFASFNAIADNSIGEPLYQVFSEEVVLATLKDMQQFDFRVLSLHWGDEYIHIPSINQINMAKKFIDNGANIIIGHHPHVIQPVMEYNKGLVFFSLGNYLFDMIYKNNVRYGLISYINFYNDKTIDYQIQGIKIQSNYSPKVVSQYQFNKYITPIYDLFNKFMSYSDDKYNNEYLLMLKRKRLIQRCVMKLDMLKHLSHINRNDILQMRKRALSLFNS